MFDASLVHGAMLLKASLHGLKRHRGGWGGRSPPHLQTQRRCDGFWEGSYGFCLCRQDDTWSDVAQLKKGEPPLQLETDCLYDEFWKALKQFCVWCKSSSWCYVLENKPAQPKKKPGGVGGGAAPPFANTTSLWRVLRGSIWVLSLLAGWCSKRPCSAQ